jgi:antitoxin (DNA-binding transcriptional repressor) of toxin-antitoxin stability system
MCHIISMQSFNMRQLRDTRKLKALLRAGKTVILQDRDQVIARIIPENRKQRPAKMPDFEDRRKRIFGDRVLRGSDVLIQERGRY